MKILILIFLFVTSSYSANIAGQTCSYLGLYQVVEPSSITYNNGPVFQSDFVPQYLDNYLQKVVYNTVTEEIPWDGNTYVKYTSVYYYCTSVAPTCTGEEVYVPATSTSPAECSAPPLPPCPDGQSYDEASEGCICETGYPLYGGLNEGIVECVQPSCPAIDDNNYPLKLENVSYSTCADLFNPVLGYGFNFVSDPNSPLTCCYSDTVKNIDDNSSCPVNHILNQDGLCTPIPDSADDDTSCELGSYWSRVEQSCLPFYSEDANATDDQSGSDDGLNSDGSTRGSGETTSYTGGGDESNSTDRVLLEYNEDEVNDMMDKYSNTIEKSFIDFIVSNTKELVSLYTISIPSVPSCGCTNPSYDINLLGHGYSDTIDICSPMADLLDILKPILWFFFLIGLLFNFFGRSD